MDRVIVRELLDDLPADDPRAVHARRDLRRVNVWMGQARIMAAVLGDAFRRRPPRSIVELGAGDGTFLLRVARRLGPAWKPSVTLVDQQELLDARTEAAFAALSWKVRPRRTDVFDWANIETASNDLTIANLFLHHFTNDQLQALFTRVAHLTGFFAACEPRRSTLALRASSLLRLIGCNEVTLHDASASVRAGFADKELSTLWPTDAEWRLEEHGAGWASHFFAAGSGGGQTGLVNSIRHDGPPR